VFQDAGGKVLSKVVSQEAFGQQTKLAKHLSLESYEVSCLRHLETNLSPESSTFEP